MIQKLHIFISIFFIISSCSSNLKNLEEPKHIKNEQYIKHFAYSLQYNEKNEQADWVAYNLISSELIKKFKRTNKFKKDTLVITKTADNNDYKHSGYDKGHLAPAADMVWNKKAITESFYFSNISPQLASFNRGMWKRLEKQTRDWAKKYNSIYITCGPLCKDSNKTIGKDSIVIPTYFYKALLIYNDTIKQAIGFIFPHKKCKGKILDYAINIDSLEKFTKLDFFYKLPNNIENKIEKNYDKSFWFNLENSDLNN